MTPTLPSDDEALARRLAEALRQLPDAPPAWVAAATALWSSPAAQPLLDAAFPSAAGAGGGLVSPPPAAGWRAWVATLVFDSAATHGTALGMRGGAPADATRQLLYRVAGRDIDLRVQVGATGYHLSGQLLGPEEPGWWTVQPVAPAQPGAPATPAPPPVPLDDLGGFEVQGLAAGVYQLTLRLASGDINLPPLTLGDDEPGAC